VNTQEIEVVLFVHLGVGPVAHGVSAVDQEPIIFRHVIDGFCVSTLEVDDLDTHDCIIILSASVGQQHSAAIFWKEGVPDWVRIDA